MKIAVLTAGPSLPEVWCEEFAHEYDRVIAVNGAGFFFASDYYAFVDRCIWDALSTKRAFWPKRGFITHQNWPVGECERIELPLYNRHLGRVPKALADEQAVMECGYTFPSALLAAQDMAQGGPVDIYGFDYTREPQVAMSMLPANGVHDDPRGYTKPRWRRELPWVKHCWGPNVRTHGKAHPAVIAWLRGEGTENAAMAALTP